MDSFRELLEAPVVTEGDIRFRCIDWVISPNGDHGIAPAFKCVFDQWIPLFAEIGGKRFLHYKDFTILMKNI